MQNGDLKKVNQTIMYITCSIIIDRNVDNDLWLKIMPVITQVKNIKPNSLFKHQNLYKVYLNKDLKLSYPQIFGFIICIFIYKNKYIMTLLLDSVI